MRNRTDDVDHSAELMCANGPRTIIVYASRADLAAAFGLGASFKTQKVDVLATRVNEKTLRWIDGGLIGEVNPFWGVWSASFLHSSDVILAGAPIIAEVLDQGDVIARIEDMRFLQPMINQQRWFVRELQGKDDSWLTSFDKTTACFTAILKSSRGKRIGIAACETDSPVCGSRKWCNFMFESIQPIRALTKTPDSSIDSPKYSAPLSPSAFTPKNDIGGIVILATVMDIVMMAGHALFDQHRDQIASQSNLRLAASFRDFDIPSLESLIQGVSLEVGIDFSQKKHTRKAVLLPLQATFFDTEEKRVGGGTFIAGV